MVANPVGGDPDPDPLFSSTKSVAESKWTIIDTYFLQNDSSNS